MRKFLAVTAIGLSLLFASGALAVTITVNDVTGSWLNPVGGSVAIVNGDPTSYAYWGTGNVGSSSSYYFTSEVPPAAAVSLPPSPTDWIDLGDFTHNNFPIPAGSSPTQIDFRLDVSLDVDGSASNVIFDYTFTHDETPNATPCAYPGDPACSDAVSISAPTGGTFLVGGTLYTLELQFRTPAGAATTQFVTQEGLSNDADIYGRFTAEVASVPEPGSFLLLSMGLLGLGVIRSRRRS